MEYVKTIIDLAIASFLLYKLVSFIKGTRSMQVALGLLLLLLITYLVQALQLTVTSWLLEQFWLAGILLLVVVFQPEIRHALAELGKNPILAKILPTERLGFIDQLIAAVGGLAAKRLGALIVLEQDHGLRHIVSTGTPIYGEVSQEILLSIFGSNSPLHDGAVLVGCDGRLHAAHCILPLSDDPRLEKNYGTRHRAAVGLTENSDAVVLVVSEGTGQVSVARNGRLDPEVNLDTLAQELKALYQAKAKKGLLRGLAEAQGGGERNSLRV